MLDNFQWDSWTETFLTNEGQVLKSGNAKSFAVFSLVFFEPATDSQDSINLAFDQLIDKFSISLVMNVYVKEAAGYDYGKEKILVKAETQIILHLSNSRNFISICYKIKLKQNSKKVIYFLRQSCLRSDYETISMHQIHPKVWISFMVGHCWLLFLLGCI